MIFDATYFGYGIGLVMAGWVMGELVGIMLTVIGRVRDL